MLLLLTTFIVSGCSNDVERLSKKLELDFPKIESSEIIDTHSGFHGDGETLIKIVFEDKTLGTQLEGKWSKLPLSENLHTAVYGLETETERISSLIKLETEENFIPEIENGYYYFYDRHSESNNPYSDGDLLIRYSYNFSIAIYDCENSTLYYAEIDT